MPVDEDQLLRTPRFPADPCIGDTIDRFDDLFDLSGQTIRRLKVVTPDLDLDLVALSRAQAQDE